MAEASEAPAASEGAEATAAPAATEAPAKPVTIEVYYPVAVDAPIAKILQGYIADFQKQYPNITVKPVFAGGYGDVKTTIQTTIEGGRKPPALAVMLAADLFDLVNADYIIPLDDFIKASPDGQAYIDDFYPAFMANSKYDGKIWSIPFQRSVVTLYYNADLLNRKVSNRPTVGRPWPKPRRNSPSPTSVGASSGPRAGLTGCSSPWPSATARTSSNRPPR